MFATKEFIEASRDYVCVRLESFESQANQDIVRKILNGRFANTAFCIMKPDGETMLSRGGRSPEMSLGGNLRPNDQSTEERAQSNPKVLAEMKRIAAKYPSKGDDSEAVVCDFHSFKQALNVSSGDQRLLVYTVAPKGKTGIYQNGMKKVANHTNIIGKFHYDFADSGDTKWMEVIEGEKAKTGIFIIQPGEFGQKGKVLAELPLSSSSEKISDALVKSNQAYAAEEKRKDYSAHRSRARRAGIKYEDNMPWGEDRDGDGKIDARRNRG